MKVITNIKRTATGDVEDPKMQKTHAVKIASNQLVKLAEENNVPIFIAFYDFKKGYQYNALFPEEIEGEDLSSEYNRFFEFLKTCISFNKEACRPVVSRKKTQ